MICFTKNAIKNNKSSFKKTAKEYFLTKSEYFTNMLNESCRKSNKNSICRAEAPKKYAFLHYFSLESIKSNTFALFSNIILIQ